MHLGELMLSTASRYTLNSFLGMFTLTFDLGDSTERRKYTADLIDGDDKHVAVDA